MSKKTNRGKQNSARGKLAAKIPAAGAIEPLSTSEGERRASSLRSRRLWCGAAIVIVAAILANVLFIHDWSNEVSEDEAKPSVLYSAPPPSGTEPATNKSYAIRAVGNTAPNRRGDIVFVHGVEGDDLKTWQCDERDSESFWPRWIARDHPDLGVWCIRYDAHILDWFGDSMPIVDRANHLLQELRLNKPSIGRKPLVFIAHSLGGLVVKEMIRQAAEFGKEADTKSFTRETKGVFFLGTPNTGSALNSMVQYAAEVFKVSDFLRPSSLQEELRANSAATRALHVWFRENAPKLHIAGGALCEKYPLRHGMPLIVDETSADPDLPNVKVVPVPKNHLTIAKPTSTTDIIYTSVVEFIERNLIPDDVIRETIETINEKFRAAKKNAAEMSAFNQKYGGRRIQWDAVTIRFIHPHNEQPAYSIAANVDSHPDDFIIATFDPDLFDGTVKIGDIVAIEGMISRTNSMGTAKLNDCRWLNERSSQAQSRTPNSE